MTLEEVVCHWQHVEAEVTPDCLCIQTTSENVHEGVFVLEDWWGAGVQKQKSRVCVHGSVHERVLS